MSSLPSPSKNVPFMVMDNFAIRQFNNPSYTGTQVNFDVQEFEDRVNSYYQDGYKLVDGYAPFW